MSVKIRKQQFLQGLNMEDKQNYAKATLSYLQLFLLKDDIL